MKMVYERPMMQVEQYVANAYCGACKDNPTPNLEEMIVNYGQTGQNWIGSFDWERQDGNYVVVGTNAWTKPQNETFDLDHTFISEKREDMTNPNTNQAQWYWQCSCCAEGSHYYLEYSADWTTRLGKDSFVLFKETTGDSTLQVGTANTFPAREEAGIDRAIAMVTYTNPMMSFS